MTPEPLIPPHGGYRELKSYQMAEIIYDATVVFCDRLIEKRSKDMQSKDIVECIARGRDAKWQKR